jgi:hypothetical protein
MSGCGNGGVPTVQPVSSSSARTASLSGTVYVPNDVTGARIAGRSASAVGQDTPLTGATVSVNRMKSDGTLEAIGTDFTATTDANGQFTIEDVPEEENLIIEATKDVTIGGNPKTLKLKKVTSVTETDVTAGTVSNLNLDVSTTLGAEAMKDILVAANNGLSDANKITGADLPRETIADVESEIVTALTADQSSGNPTVNLSTVATGGETVLDSQLSTLENTTHGASIKQQKDSATTTGNVRIVVGAGGNIDGASVYLTLGGTTYTKTTDASGEAFFDGLTAEADIDVSVVKAGYEMKSIRDKVSKVANVREITVLMSVVKGNQAPVSNAGPDQNVAQHSVVSLDGSGSFDPDGDSITYSWTQTSGTAVTLSTTTAIKPTFTSATSGVLVFALTVSDGGLTSQVDVVTITVGAVACMNDADCDDNDLLTIDSCQNAATASAICGHVPIACNLDEDCNDSNLMTFDACSNPGTSSAMCSHTAIACNSDTDCTDNNAHTTDTCLNPNTTISSCLNFDNPPAAVTLSSVSNVLVTSMDISWTQSTDGDFDSYKVYMSQTAGVSESSALVATIPGVSTVVQPVTGLSESTAYYFKIYVCDATQCVGSNELSAHTGTLINATTLNANTTWDISGSPYVIVGNVIVPSGITLTIDPGVTVKYSGAYTIEVSGAIISNGTQNNKISFTSSTGLNSGAVGISFADNADISLSSLSFTELELLGTAIYIVNSSGILNIDNMDIENNAGSAFYGGCGFYSRGKFSGIVKLAGDNSIVITNSRFINNEGAIATCGNFTAIGSTFSANNNSEGISVDATWGGANIQNSVFLNDTLSTESGTISHSSFSSTNGEGTAITTSAAIIEYSEISGYSTGIIMHGASSTCAIANMGECLSYNNIYNNSLLNLNIDLGTQNVVNNWWGSTTDFKLGGGATYIYEPFLTDPEPTAGPQ